MKELRHDPKKLHNRFGSDLTEVTQANRSVIFVAVR